jgi:aerobic carbon-monoxide dehydrogenase large subunit
VGVDYEVLPYRADPLGPGSGVPVWEDVPDDVCFDWRFGDADACRRLFGEAAHVVDIDVHTPRVCPYPIEPRAAVGFYDPHGDAMVLLANTQGGHFVRNTLADAFSRRRDSIRVVTPNVGGGFGSKIYAYPEHALVLEAARRLRRPVRWAATRAEALLSDTQGRGHVTHAALALDSQLRFLALSVRPTVDLGAYLSQLTPLTATGVGAPVQGGAYRFQAVEITVRGMFTNKVPVDAYRGAGRPEATYVLERLIDRAATQLGVDAAELRARNLPSNVTGDFAAVTGLMIGGGRFLDNQTRCLEVADRVGFPRRRMESARHGLLRGFGFACYLEANGGLQVAEAVHAGSFPVESAALTFGADGTLDVVIGTQSSGQDHALPVRLLAAQRLAIDPARVTVREGDSAMLAAASGTGGSKSTLTSLAALQQALDDALRRAHDALAEKWGTPSISFSEGVFRAPDGYRATIADVASDFPGVLDGRSQAELRRGSSANGCHACEVEIDASDGVVRVVRYTAVDDFGRVLHSATVRGQVQGGVAQGIGQALFERAPSIAELLDGSAHYRLPTSMDIPTVVWVDNGLPSTLNALGAKGCGEAGAAAAPPAVMNAVIDALRDYPSAASLQMPVLPADVLAVLRG